MYEPRTAGEWFEICKSTFNRICSDLGMPTPRYDRVEFTTMILVILAQVAAEIDDMLAGMLDHGSIFNASGSLLADLAYLAGVNISAGTKSSVTLRLTAWSNGPVLVSKGKTYGDGVYKWIVDEDVLIPSGGTGDVLAVCEVTGPVRAGINTITTRVDIVTGIVAVTNPAEATLGTYKESPASIRARIFSGLFGGGSFSPLAIKSAIENLPDVDRCRIVFNPSEDPLSSSGVSIPPFGVGVWVYPSTIPSSTKAKIINALHALLAATTNYALPVSADVTAGDGVLGYIVGADKRDHAIGFWYMKRRGVRVRVEIGSTGLLAGYTVASVTTSIIGVIQQYFDSLEPGSEVSHDDLIGLIAAILGVKRTEVKFAVETYAGSGVYGSFTTADVIVDPAEFARVDSATVVGV